MLEEEEVFVNLLCYRENFKEDRDFISFNEKFYKQTILYQIGSPFDWHNNQLASLP